MVSLLVVPAALLPSLLWILIMRWWDRREPEPPRLIARLFLAGVAAALVIALLRTLAQVVLVSTGLLPPLDALSLADGVGLVTIGVIVIAAIQELVKVAVAWELTKHSPSFTEPVDGIVYTTTVAWGAAFVENGVIILSAFVRNGASALWNSPALAFTLVFTTLALGVSSGLAGLALGIARTVPSPHERLSHLTRGVTEAVFLHAAFRFLLVLAEPRLAGILIVLAAVYLFSRFAIVRLSPRRAASA